ncbi:hypothetical protein J7L67_02925 [bacterium]|nr:hypothetical protein [bacterium]
MNNKKQSSPLQKSKITATAILAKGKDNAREILSTLSNTRLVNIFITSTPKERLKILSLLDNPVHIVRAVPEEEIYWTIKEVGIKNSLPLLKLTSSDQLHFIFDVEWWDGDTLSLKRISKWLQAISKCGNSKVKQWLNSFDFELLVLTFKKFIKVFKPDEMTNDYGEAIDTLPLFTLDGIYFIQFINNETSHLLSKILTILISIDTRLFSKIMELVIWSIDSELEFESFEKTQRRLEEKGLPEYDEAREIYRFIPNSKINSIPLKEYDIKNDKKNIRKSFYPMRISTSKKLFFTKVLDRIDNYFVLEDLSLSLAHAANKVLIADNFAMNDHASFKNNLIKIAGYINIGLEVLSGNDEIRAEYELKNRWLEHIFQVGWSRVIELKQKYQTVIESLKEKKTTDLLDFPYGEILKGLDRKNPLFFSGKSKDEYNLYRNFQSLDDLNMVEQNIENIIYLTDLVFNKLGLKPIQTELDAPVYYQEAKPSLNSLFMTGLLHKIIKGKWIYQAVGLEDIQRFFVWMFNSNTRFMQQQFDNILSEIMQILESSLNCGFNERQKLCLNEFLSSCLKDMEQEYKEATEDGFFDFILFKSIYVQQY